MRFPAYLLTGFGTLLCTTTEGVPFQRGNSVSTFFGGARRTSCSVIDLPRGGEEVAEVAEPEVLYLPGLLDVELKKSKQVSLSETSFCWVTNPRFSVPKSVSLTIVATIHSPQLIRMLLFRFRLPKQRNWVSSQEMQWPLWEDVEEQRMGVSKSVRRRNQS